MVPRYELPGRRNDTSVRCGARWSARTVDAMVLTTVLAVPGLLILLVPAAAPLFELWDDRASERAMRAAHVRDEDPVPAPRSTAEAVRPAAVPRGGAARAATIATPEPVGDPLPIGSGAAGDGFRTARSTRGAPSR